MIIDSSGTRAAPRDSGIDCVGPLHWGAHICLMYSSREELLEILVPYFREGLHANEYCIWITSQAMTPEEAAGALRAAVPDLDDHLARGQIEIFDYREWYMPDGCFDGARVSRAWLEKLDGALARGFEGMRLSGDTYWLDDDDWEPFLQYEARLDPVIIELPMLAICSYALEKLGPRGTVDATANHEFTIIRERGRWTSFKSFARCRSEQFIHESEARLRATIDGASDAIVTCDGSGAVVLANVAAQRMFGYDPFDMIGAHVGDFVPDIGDALRGHDGARASMESEGRRRDGAFFPLEWTLSVASAKEQPLFVAFVRDLTPQRATEFRIHQLQADRLAAIGGMATALAHKINQPLTAATSYLQAAQRLMRMPEERRPASLETTLDRAAEQALRAGKLLGHIREFVSSGEPDKTLSSLHDLIDDAFALIGEAAKQMEVDVAFDFGAPAHLVLADRIQMEQVIVNLCRNAIEAMQNVPLRKLTIATSLVGDRIRVDVIDTGAGFPKEIVAELFEPFVTSKARGLGVGLSISRAIIEAHDGRIWTAPNPEGGAIVSFTLPLVEGERG